MFPFLAMNFSEPSTPPIVLTFYPEFDLYRTEDPQQSFSHLALHHSQRSYYTISRSILLLSRPNSNVFHYWFHFSTTYWSSPGITPSSTMKATHIDCISLYCICIIQISIVIRIFRASYSLSPSFIFLYTVFFYLSSTLLYPIHLFFSKQFTLTSRFTFSRSVQLPPSYPDP